MTYVISDIHGRYDKYIKMFDLIGLKAGDVLYVLGDVIDRGDGGIDILLDMMERKNIIPLIGNHEALALPVMKALHSGKPFEDIKRSKEYLSWAVNGGDVTARAFIPQSKETQIRMIEYIESFLISKEIVNGGKRFHLSHTLPEYDPDKDIKDASYNDLIWGEPDYDIRYDTDVTFITGHTPTHLIDPEYKGRILRGNGHIAVDCGAAFGGRLGCICLESMEEFYV